MADLSQKAKEAKRAYKREWRAKNRDRILQYNREYRKRNREKLREMDARYWEKKAAEGGKTDAENETGNEIQPSASD